MKIFIYVIIKDEEAPMHIGYSHDILKTVEFYKKMPSLNNRVSRLIYLEIAPSVESANIRFEELRILPLNDLIVQIKKQNPDFITIQPGINMDI